MIQVALPAKFMGSADSTVVESFGIVPGIGGISDHSSSVMRSVTRDMFEIVYAISESARKNDGDCA